jgi:hypothetical protein
MLAALGVAALFVGSGALVPSKAEPDTGSAIGCSSTGW